MGVVSAHQLSAFSSPVNGTTPIDANTVRGNDNSIRTSYNAHDADGTIHVQNGLVASRPAAATAGYMWLASDTGAVYLYLDTGSAWVEANYLRNTGGTITGTLIVTAGIVVTGGGQFSRTAATDTNVVIDAPTGNGGMVRFRDAGTDKWLVGKAAASGTGTDYEIYNAALGALAFKLTAAASAATFAGTLGVSQLLTASNGVAITGGLTASGDLNINAGKFIVIGTSGNATAAGTVAGTKIINNGAASFGSVLTATAFQLYADAIYGAGLSGFGTTSDVSLFDRGGNPIVSIAASKLGFYGTAPQVKPTVVGSRGGNVALANLMTALANLGLVTDGTV